MKVPSFAEALVGEMDVAATDANKTLPHAANIRRYAVVQDGAGGRSESWIADTFATYVRIGQNIPDQPLILGERIKHRVPDYHITWPAALTLHQKDRVLDSASGISYELQELAQVGDFSALNEGYASAVDQPYTTVMNGVTALQPVYADNDIVSYDFFHEGVAVTGLSKSHRRIVGNWACLSVAVTANTAPGVAPTVFDVLLNGVTIFTTTAHRPTLAAGSTSMVTVAPDVYRFSDGDDLQVSTLSIGDPGTPGSDVTLQVIVTPR